MPSLWEDSFLLKRLEREYDKLKLMQKQYNLISKDDFYKKERISKMKELKDQYHKIKEMETGWY